MSNYYRPESISEAFALLKNPNTIPLAGGTYINTKLKGRHNVVDLQNIGLDKIMIHRNKIEVGSTTKLEQFLQNNSIPGDLKSAIKLEAPLNFRNSASLGGLLLTCKGRSPIATSLLALDAIINIEPDQKTLPLSDFFTLRSDFPPGSLITSIIFSSEQTFSFNYVARTPFDQPIVCAALSSRKNGRTRLALGGYGFQPILVVDGDISDDISSAAFSAYRNAEDEWASANYRSDMARVLSMRCLDSIKSKS